ncbi:hypothetical protein [Chthoniobacter flavus]|nr:hypothetical protein [Chthoniobacter flavus]
MHYHVSGKGRLLEITVDDGVTKQDVLASWRAIAAHPAYAKAVAGLVIFSKDMKWELSGHEMSELGHEVSRLKPLHWAFVAPEPLSYGMSRMFATQAEGGGTYQIFDNEPTARKWLRTVLP